MIDLPVEMAPGCFGSALAFKATDNVCTHCPFRAQCEPLHQINRARLQARFGIVAPPPKRMKAAAAAPVDPAPVLKASQRYEALLARLNAGGFNVVATLQAGQNPFARPDAGDLRELLVACALLLKGRVVTPDLLQTACREKLHMDADEALIRSRIALKALVSIGAVDMTDAGASIRTSDLSL